MKYLYGAAVQGIQSFIFATGKLKEIAGASELVESICTSEFQKLVKNFDTHQLIIGAAGNIKYVFESKDDCEAIVKLFPRHVSELAPGITLNQSVVEFNSPLGKSHIDELEKRLITQRNIPKNTSFPGMMVSERSRRTGLPGISNQAETIMDEGQNAKIQYSDNARNTLMTKLVGEQILTSKYPFDMDHISGDKENSWIAIVHADGNDLGKKIMNIAGRIDDEQTQNFFKQLSVTLETATIKAASAAYTQVVRPRLKEQNRIPIRPVLLGGDDLTVIIRGDLALDFTTCYLNEFQAATKAEFASFERQFNVNDFDNGLSACAGIAYIKTSYPFHYGVELADTLCKQAKWVSKSIRNGATVTPSSLLFHKVHASFIEDYDEIVKKEMTASDARFDNGPYFIQEQEGYNTAYQLKEWVDYINRPDYPKSSLKNWISILPTRPSQAEQRMHRIKTLNKNHVKKNLQLEPWFTQRDIVENGQVQKKKFTHLFDVLSISDIQK